MLYVTVTNPFFHPHLLYVPSLSSSFMPLRPSLPLTCTLPLSLPTVLPHIYLYPTHCHINNPSRYPHSHLDTSPPLLSHTHLHLRYIYPLPSLTCPPSSSFPALQHPLCISNKPTNPASYPTCVRCSLQQWGCTALIQASYNGHTEIVQALLAAAGINVNHADVSIYYTYSPRPML